jgi:hypothetical protein
MPAHRGVYMSHEECQTENEIKKEIPNEMRCVECDTIFKPVDSDNNICSMACYLSYHGVDYWP